MTISSLWKVKCFCLSYWLNRRHSSIKILSFKKRFAKFPGVSIQVLMIALMWLLVCFDVVISTL